MVGFMLKKLLCFFLVLCFTVPSLVVNVNGDGHTNIIANPSFEEMNTNQDRFTGIRPMGWNFLSHWGTEGYYAGIDGSTSYSGSSSLRLSGNNPNVRVAVSQDVKGLSPDKYYKVSGYIKTSGYFPAKISPTGPAIRVNSVGTASYFLTETIVKPGQLNDVDWTYVENIFTPGQPDIRIDCFFDEAEGVAWFDDIKLVEYEPIVGVEMSKSGLTLSCGDEAQLFAKVFPSAKGDVPIEWKSSDPTLVWVDNEGKIKASEKYSGKALICAVAKEELGISNTTKKATTTMEIEGVCLVTVQEKQRVNLEEIKLSKREASMELNGEQLVLSSFFIPSNSSNKELSWESSDTNIAVVKDGVVTAVSEGIAYISAVSKENNEIFDYCKVTVLPSSKKIDTIDIKPLKININTSFDEKVRSSGYPKLLFSFEDLPHIRNKAQNGYLAKGYQLMAKAADDYMEKGPRVHPVQAAGGRVLHANIANLAMNGYILRDEKYINRAIDLMMESAATYTGQSYLNMNGDIGIGDAAHAYAMGYDWLYPFMTQEQREIIREKLESLGEIIYNLPELTLERPGVTSNHNSVTAGGLGLAALVLGDKPKWVSKAREQIVEYYKTSTDNDGFNGEGISYYCYGALGGHTFAHAYLRVNPNDDIIDKYAKGREFLENMVVQYMKPNGGGYIPINDSSGTIDSPGIIYIISKYKSRTGLWAYLKLVGEEGDKSYGLSSPSSGASIPYSLIWADPSIEPISPDEAGAPVTTQFQWGYSVFRDGFGPMDSVATFMSGYLPHRGHNQRDENSFTYYAKGEEFAIDPGYTPRNSISHNTLMIDGVGQEVPGGQYDVYGKTIYTKEYDGASLVVGDATETYPKRLGLESVKRQMLFSRAKGNNPSYMVVVDDVVKRNNNRSTISWLLQTPKANNIVLEDSSAKIVGANYGNIMEVSFPFSNDVFLRVDSFARRKLIGTLNVTYMNTNTLKTLEAVVSAGKNTRIVSVMIPQDHDKVMPKVKALGQSNNGTVEIHFEDGTKDIISFDDGYMKFDRTNDAQTISYTAVKHPTVEQMESKKHRAVTVEIDGEMFDTTSKIEYKDGQVYVPSREFSEAIILSLGDAAPEVFADEIIEEYMDLEHLCDILGVFLTWDEEMLHASIKSKFNADEVMLPNKLYSKIQDEKLKIVSIDARLDQTENPPAHAIDGDLSTIYAVEGDSGIPVILELSQVSTINAVAVALSRGDVRMARFDILISEDKENWTLVYRAESGGTTEEFEGYSFGGVKGKYVKILGFGNSANVWNSFREIEVFGKN